LRLYHIVAYRAQNISDLAEDLELGYATIVNEKTKTWPKRPFSLRISHSPDLHRLPKDVLSRIRGLFIQDLLPGSPELPLCDRIDVQGICRLGTDTPFSLKPFPRLRILTDHSLGSFGMQHSFGDWPNEATLKVVIDCFFDRRPNEGMFTQSNLKCIHLRMYYSIDFTGTKISGSVQTVLIQHKMSLNPRSCNTQNAIDFLECVPDTIERLIISTPDPEPIIKFCNKRFTKITTRIIAKVVNLAEFEY
jgi:hypothetical protein